MESGIQSSFIPHDANVETVRVRPSGGLPEFILLISVVLFVASAALGAGVFLYQQYLQTSRTSKIAQLERAKAAFEPALITQLTRLEERMHAGDTILGLHLAPSAFFEALQQATLSTVSFSNLNLEAGDAQNIVVRMSGVAQSVNSIALQAEIFSKNGVITSPIFTDIARQLDGVHFSLSALVNPAAINFNHILSSIPEAATNGEVPAQPQPGGSLFNGPSVSNQENQ